MKTIVAFLLCLLLIPASHASVAFDSTGGFIGPFQGTTTATSSSFTPAASGEAVLVVGLDENAYNNASISFSGTGTYLQRAAMQAIFDNAPGNGYYYLSGTTNTNGGMGYNIASSSGSQTATVTTGTSGDPVDGFAAVYSGVAHARAVYADFNSSTQTTITGFPVVVPPGGMVVALIFDWSGYPGTDTITVAAGGTSRGHGNGLSGSYAWNWSDWSGSGTITPTWTVATAGDNYFIWEWVLAPSGKVIEIQAAPSNINGTLNGQTITMPMAVSVGDVLAVEIAGQAASSSLYPVTLTTSGITTGGWTSLNNYYETTTAIAQYGAIYFAVATSAGTPVISMATSDAAANGYGAAIQLSGFAGTPMKDASAAVQNLITTAQPTQTLSISTHQNNEILFIAPWSGSYVTNLSTGYTQFPSITVGIYDAGFYDLTYTNPGAENFSGTLDESAVSLTVGGGLYDATGSSCTHDFWANSGSYAIPNGSSGSYWSTTGAFSTPNCSSGSYWLSTGATGSN